MKNRISEQFTIAVDRILNLKQKAMTEKKFKLNEEDIKELVKPMGYCFASDKITVNGEPVGYMYREIPMEKEDSGWRFFSGTEEEEYIDDENNVDAFEVNVIANFDKAIIPYLNAPFDTDFQRIEATDSFEIITDLD